MRILERRREESERSFFPRLHTTRGKEAGGGAAADCTLACLRCDGVTQSGTAVTQLVSPLGPWTFLSVLWVRLVFLEKLTERPDRRHR